MLDSKNKATPPVSNLDSYLSDLTCEVNDTKYLRYHTLSSLTDQEHESHVPIRDEVCNATIYVCMKAATCCHSLVDQQGTP